MTSVHDFIDAVWSLVDGNCEPKAADAFEQSIRLIYDLLEQEEVKEVVERISRDKS